MLIQNCLFMLKANGDDTFRSGWHSMRLLLLTFILFMQVFPSVMLGAENVNVSTPDSALQASNAVEEQILLYEQTIEDLEIQHGGFDRSLLEPLQGLAQAYIASGDFDAGQGILRRRLQLIRTLEGPESLEQLPILEAMISNSVVIADWDSVSEGFELINLLYTRDPNSQDLERINSKNDLAMWELVKVYTDNPRARIRNFLASRELQRENLNYIENLYAEDSLELVPWLYRHALLQYQVVTYLASDDELGLDAKDEIVRREGRNTSSYLREALNTVSRITEIVAAQADPEAEAMAMIYEADFRMILRLGSAAGLYRDAMDKLRESGIDESRIQDFFSQPVVLPQQKIYLSLAQAMAARNERLTGIRNGAGQNSAKSDQTEPVDAILLPDFVAWNESLAMVERPPVPTLAAAIEVPLHRITMEFTVNSEGKSSNPRIIDVEPDENMVRSNARKAVDRMRFRPVFEGDRRRRSQTLSLTYFYPPEL